MAAKPSPGELHPHSSQGWGDGQARDWSSNQTEETVVTNIAGRAGHSAGGHAGTQSASSAALPLLVVTLGRKSPKSHSFDLPWESLLFSRNDFCILQHQLWDPINWNKSLLVFKVI